MPNSAAIYVADANGKYLPGFNENATIPFEAGKTYRLRIINACELLGALCPTRRVTLTLTAQPHSPCSTCGSTDTT